MAKLHFEQPVTQSVVPFGWNPAYEEFYRKTPAGIAETTLMQLKIAEQLYGEKEAALKLQRLLEQEIENTDIEEIAENSSHNKKSSAFGLDDETNRLNKLLAEARKIVEESKQLNRLVLASQQTFNKVINLDNSFTSQTEHLDEETENELAIHERELQKIYSKKRRAIMTVNEYHQAIEGFAGSSRSQAEKLAILNKREEVAWYCEQEARELRKATFVLRNRLNLLPFDHPERIQIEAQISRADVLASEEEAKARSIRESVSRERSQVNARLEAIRREEARWDISAAQSGVGVNPEEHAARVAARERMLHAIQRRSVQQIETPHHFIPPWVYVRTAPTPMERDPVPSKPPLTQQEALDILGISKEQWDSLPADVPFAARKETGGPEDKMDLLMEAQIGKSQLYSNNKIAANLAKQEEIKRAYQLLDAAITKESEQAAVAPPAPPQAPSSASQPVEAAVQPAEATQPADFSNTASSPVMPVDRPPQAQIVPPRPAPASQRRMNNEERDAVAATIDRTPEISTPFYNATREQQRNLVAEQYEQAIQQRNQVSEELARIVANPSRSSELANQQDREYYESLQQEAQKKVDNYATLANYYGITPEATSNINPEPSIPAQETQPERKLSPAEIREARLQRLAQQAPSPAPETVPAPAVSTQSEAIASSVQPVESADISLTRHATPELKPEPTAKAAKSELEEVEQPVKKLSAAEMREARLQRFKQPAHIAEEAAPSIQPLSTSLSVRSTAALNIETPEERERRFATLIEGAHGVVTPHENGNGYSVTFGENNVLEVTQDPQKGKITAELSYDKDSLSPDAVAEVLSATCASAGPNAHSAIHVNGNASAEVQQALISDNIFSEKNIVRNIPQSSEKGESTAPAPAAPSNVSSQESATNDSPASPTPFSMTPPGTVTGA